MAYIPIEETKVYRLASEVSDEIYRLVETWPWLAQKGFGIQLIQAADSIGANLVEGDGRVSDTDSIRFFRYSRSSARETVHWLIRAQRREVLNRETATELIRKVDECRRMINGIITHRQASISVGTTREERVPYGTLELPDNLADHPSPS